MGWLRLAKDLETIKAALEACYLNAANIKAPFVLKDEETMPESTNTQPLRLQSY